MAVDRISSPPLKAKGPSIFTRDATGLRKEAGPFDIFIYNVNNQNIALGVVFLFGALAAYPGGNFPLTVVFGSLLVIPIYMVYSRLSADMPRSGGDYVWTSRIFGPGTGPYLGFMLAGTVMMGAFAAIGAPMVFLMQYGVAPLLRELGTATGSPGFTHAGDWVFGTTGTMIIGTIVLVLFTSIMLVGVRVYMIIQRYGFYLACLGMLLAIVVFMFTSQSTFSSAFDAYVVQAGGVKDAFALAVKGGQPTSGQPFSVQSTYFATLWTIYIIAFGAVSCYIGGEVRQPARTQRIGMFASLGFTVIGLLLLIIELLHMAGEPFFMGLANANLGLAYPPTYNEMLFALLPQTWFWAVLVGFTFIFWTYVWMPIQYFTATRLLLALSLDGYLPRAVSHVNQRFATPDIAIVICGIAGWISLYLFVSGILSVITLVFAAMLMFFVSGIAAALYPFRMPRVWASSGPDRIMGIPTITIWGILQAVFAAIMAHICWADPFTGIRLTNANIILNVGAPVLSLVVGVIVIFVRRAGGTDLRLATAEIPVE